jgi:hypothetical protein
MTKVLGVLGSAYCGSTFLNANLNTHPEIFGAGETHWVTNRAVGRNTKRLKEKSKGCARCETSCPVFDPNEFPLETSGLYQSLTRKTGASWICDTSKQPAYFHEVIKRNPEVSFRFVVLIKEPSEAASSFLKRGWGKGDANSVLRSWIVKYKEIDSFCKTQARPLALKTKDLRSNLNFALDRIALFMGIEPSFGTDLFSDLHQIAGNKEFLASKPIEFRETFQFKPELLEEAQDLYSNILALSVFETPVLKC